MISLYVFADVSDSMDARVVPSDVRLTAQRRLHSVSFEGAGGPALFNKKGPSPYDDACIV